MGIFRDKAWHPERRKGIPHRVNGSRLLLSVIEAPWVRSFTSFRMTGALGECSSLGEQDDGRQDSGDGYHHRIEKRIGARFSSQRSLRTSFWNRIAAVDE